jgi:hypothetical protein
MGLVVPQPHSAQVSGGGLHVIHYSGSITHGVHDPWSVPRSISPKTGDQMDTDTEHCGNCEKPVSLDTDVQQFCNEDGVLGEGPICSDCLNRPDAESCAKCGALYWTGIPRPYIDDNAPMSVWSRRRPGRRPGNGSTPKTLATQVGAVPLPRLVPARRAPPPPTGTTTTGTTT